MESLSNQGDPYLVIPIRGCRRPFSPLHSSRWYSTVNDPSRMPMAHKAAQRSRMKNTMRVLVTDDDPDVLSLETEVLRQHGYEVLEAATGEAYLQSVRIHRPDLVLLDVVLPDTTGVELCTHIKRDPDLRDTFVILTSGVRVASEYRAEGLNTGADG
jgi:CheY-like chemotaxis protein